MKLYAALIIAVAFTFSPAYAEESADLFGSPMVEESGQMTLDGVRIDFWGIHALAGDQQCWTMDEKPWPCGEHASTALKHYVSGKLVRCKIKETANKNKTFAQCFFDSDDKTHDIARYLVSNGWAMDNSEQSLGLYENDEQEARHKRRAIWTSRFQTAEDWRNGIDRYIKYEMEPEPDSEKSAEVTKIAPPTPVIVQPVIVVIKERDKKRHKSEKKDDLSSTATTEEVDSSIKNTDVYLKAREREMEDLAKKEENAKILQ
ncbi:MAG: thermonuclease family protein [Alphaproteobacteria bacterium]|nr:thermonuclease family protein [Alphaproteobacteria bacterium]